MEMNRRSFLKGASTVAAGAMAASMVGVSANALAEEPKGTGEFDYEADVIVVGAGGAGFCAVAGAHEMGASTLLLEKQGFVGGDTLMSKQDILGFWPTRQFADAGEYDLLENYIADWRATHPNSNKGIRGEELPDDIPLTMRYTELFEPAMNWASEAGVEFAALEADSSLATDYSFQPREWRAPMGSIIPKLAEEVATYDDYRLITDAEAYHLIQDEDGRVIGVSFMTFEGKVYNAKAYKGVVLCTGSFCANPYMICNYMNNNYAHLSTAGAISCTGDGVRMALAAGGYVVDMDLGINWEPSLLGSRDFWVMEDHMKRIGTNSDAIARYDPAILVGFDGKRFYNETLGYAGMARNTANLPYSLSFYVWDNSLVDPLFMEGLEADEILIQADTLEELAHKMPDIDEEQFLATVEQWNGYVEAGEDPDFGRPVEGLTKIEQPPFHAVILQPQPYITLGGVKTDVDSRVLRTDGTPIPGLYAAGQVTGCYAEMEGLMYLGGVGQAMAFGMQAGKLAAQEEGLGKAPAFEKAEAVEAATVADAADGSWTGVGTGMGGKINVTIEISGGQITDVTSISPNAESVGVGGYEAIEDGTFVAQILEAQGAEIDGVAGATITSDAIRTAVQDALEKARA